MTNICTLQDLKRRVSEARQEGYRESVSQCGRRGMHQSRGTWLCTANAGGQCSPNAEAECITWRGTLREIRDLIAEVEAKYPDVNEIYIAGGYDWALNPRDFADGAYDPWTAAWSVTVWSREVPRA